MIQLICRPFLRISCIFCYDEFRKLLLRHLPPLASLLATGWTGKPIINLLGTIHLRRRQIFTIFDPYPPTIGIPAKCL